MSADVATTLAAWSVTEGSNLPTGSTAISTNLDDNLRMMQAVVRTLAASNTIASATTTDLSTINETFVSVTGTTTITALGTVSAGIYKWLIFGGALTFAHNGTSLILPSGANISTAAGDTALVVSLGSGNWRCLAYSRSNGQPVGSSALLSNIGAAIAANTIANTDYAQVWQWKLTTAAKSAFAITETTASTGGSGSQYLLDVATVAASTANPFRVSTRAAVDSILVDRTGAITIKGNADTDVKILGGDTSGANGGDIYLTAGEVTSSGEDGGGVFIAAGGSGNANCGGVTITAGTKPDSGTRINGGTVSITAGSAGGTTGNADGGDVNVVLGYAGGSGAHGKFRVEANSAQVFQVLGNESHFVVGGTSPTIASGGGTGVTITGKDQAFFVTAGTGSPTSVTVNFAQTWTTAPIVCATSSQSGQVLHVSSVSTTQVVIASSAAFSSGTKIYVQSMGYE